MRRTCLFVFCVGEQILSPRMLVVKGETYHICVCAEVPPSANAQNIKTECAQHISRRTDFGGLGRYKAGVLSVSGGKRSIGS